MRMRNKFLSYLLVFAMVFGCVTYIGSKEAKADDYPTGTSLTMTINFTKPADWTGVGVKVAEGDSWAEISACDVNNDNATFTANGDAGTILTEQDGYYTVSFSTTRMWGLHVIFNDNGTWTHQTANLNFAYDFEAGNYTYYLDNSSSVFDGSATQTAETMEAFTTEPTPASVSSVISLINDIGVISLESNAAIILAENAYNALSDADKSGVDNYDTLTEARSAYNTLVANGVIEKITAIGTVTVDSGTKIDTAESAYNTLNDAQKKLVTNYATLTAAKTKLAELTASSTDLDVILHITIDSSISEWGDVYGYSWLQISDDESTSLLGNWPGNKINADSANTGWYTTGYNLPSTYSSSTPLKLIIGNGLNSDQTGAKQTDNLTISAKGEYWLTVTTATEGYTVTSENMTTTKPANWVNSTVEAVPTPAPSATPAPVDTSVPAKAKFHFKNSENWEKVGIYFTTGDKWTEVTGKWPGEAMTLETGSKTWLEYDYYGTEESYNYIINNMVSDDDVKADATKVKIQTLNIEKATAGEYWITLGEKDAEGKFATSITTTAPADYDGKGIAAKKAADWTAAKASIESAIAAATDDKAASVEIAMNDSTTVPKDILETIKGKNVNVEFKMNGGSWVVNGKSITDASKDLNLGFTMNASTIDTKKVDKLTSKITCDKAIQLSLDHDGAFGCDLTLKVYIDKALAGKNAVLFYYNPTDDKFEGQMSVKIDADGYGSFDFKHASDYVIAVGDKVVSKTVSAKTGDVTPVVGMSFMMLIAAAGITFVYRKRKMFA